MIYKKTLTLMIIALELLLSANELWAESDVSMGISINVNQHSCHQFQKIFDLPLRHSENKQHDQIYNDYLKENKSLFQGQTATWAQEYAGIDLMKEELEKLKKSENLKQPSIAIFDSGFWGLDKTNIQHQYEGEDGWEDGNHGAHTANLTLSNSIVSSGGVGSIDYVIEMKQPEDYQKAVQIFEKIGYPSIINNSMIHWHNSKSHQALQKIASHGTTIVVSGGNHYPSNHSILPSVASNLLTIGWIGANGFYHPSSTDGKQLDLVAPSGMSMLSKSTNEGYSFFGGSSGSTPLVSGVATNLVGLLGHSHISVIEPILKKSALKYPLQNSLNGAGLLNSYKAFKVAQKIRNKCNTSKFCIENEVLNPHNYEFNSDTKLLQRAKEAIYKEIPSCKSHQPSSYNMNDCSLKESIQILRKDFFLTKDKDSANILSCVYQSLGFKNNASFYNFYSQNQLTKQAIDRMSDDDFFRHLRYAPHISDTEVQSRVSGLITGLIDSDLDLDTQRVVGQKIGVALYAMGQKELNSDLKKQINNLIKTLPTPSNENGNTEFFKTRILFSKSEYNNYAFEKLVRNKKLTINQVTDLLCFERLVLKDRSFLNIAKNVEENFFFPEDSLHFKGTCELLSSN